MIDIGVASPSAQGQAMISTATAASRAWANRGSGTAAARPGEERGQGDRQDHRHEISGDGVGQPLDRRTAALRLGHHADDLGQHSFASHALGPHEKAAGAVDRAADHPRPPSVSPPASARR